MCAAVTTRGPTRPRFREGPALPPVLDASVAPHRAQRRSAAKAHRDRRPGVTRAGEILSRARARTRRALELDPLRRRLGRTRHRLLVIGVFRRTSPYSGRFGYERGTPVDRVYIERFLEANAPDIRGCVLEVGDRLYTERYGASRVVRSDIIDVDEKNPLATFVGDLSQRDGLPENAYDCSNLHPGPASDLGPPGSSREPARTPTARRRPPAHPAGHYSDGHRRDSGLVLGRDAALRRAALCRDLRSPARAGGRTWQRRERGGISLRPRRRGTRAWPNQRQG